MQTPDSGLHCLPLSRNLPHPSVSCAAFNLQCSPPALRAVA
jgi:hypothetical protein